MGMRKSALKALVARRVLEIYGHGGGWEDVIAEFGQPRDPATKKKLGVVHLLEWAHANYLTDEDRTQGRAAVESELRRVGFCDPRRLFDQSGRLRSPLDIADDVAAAVQSIEVVTRTVPGQGEAAEVEHTHKIKMHDKLGALKQLGSLYGGFADRVEHTGKDGGALTVEVVRFGRDDPAPRE